MTKQKARNRGHLRAETGRNFCRYSVYDNKTDLPIIIDGTADECAAVLKRSRNSFYCLVSRVEKGRIKKYTILRRFEDEEEVATEEGQWNFCHICGAKLRRSGAE